jgi:hypothetical protein
VVFGIVGMSGGGMRQRFMFEFGVKFLYSIALLALAGLCASEVWRVWWDNALSYGTFKASENGEDKPEYGNSFRRLLTQQLQTLSSAYQNASPSTTVIAYDAGAQRVNISRIGVTFRRRFLSGFSFGCACE